LISHNKKSTKKSFSWN